MPQMAFASEEALDIFMYYSSRFSHFFEDLYHLSNRKNPS